MPEPVAEPALNGLRLNLRIVSIVMFNFASYLTIGLPLAVLPGYVHDVMGFSAFWAGLVISLQYFATLLSRPHAGRYADLLGPKRLSSSVYAAAFERSGISDGRINRQSACHQPVITLHGARHPWDWAKFCRNRIDPVGRWRGWLAAYRAGDFVERHCHLRGDGDGCAVRRRVLSLGRLAGVSVNHYGRGAGGHFVGDPRPTVKASKGKPLPFRAVLGSVWLYGMALALASAGFGVIATFITLFYDAKGWDGAAFALTLFSCAFVGTRLLFPNGINRIGGLNVAMICFSVEIIGLLLVGVATMPWMAKIGVLLAGAGFSLVFPALGVVAVKAVPQQNQGRRWQLTPYLWIYRLA